MRYRIAGVGKIKRGFYLDGCVFYLERLNRLSQAEIIEVRDGKGPTRQSDESSALLAAADGYVVALDERGDQFTSEEWASRVDRLEVQGVSRITFLIGGPDGHTTHLTSDADALWSLSKATLPHELARLVLLEQTYRAETIRSGHPYHRT